MENIKTKINVLKGLWESAPQELRASTPGLITNGTDIITTACIYITELQPLQSIAKYLVKDVHITPENANTWLNNCTHATFVVKNKEAIYQCITSNEECSDAVRQGVQDMMGTVTDKILIVAILSAGIYAVIEGYTCYNFWGKIINAKNLIEGNPGHSEIISRLLSDIQPSWERLDKVIADLSRTDTKSDDLDSTKCVALEIINEIRIIVDKFLNEINDLHVEVNGMREKLRLTRNSDFESPTTVTVYQDHLYLKFVTVFEAKRLRDETAFKRLSVASVATEVQECHVQELELKISELTEEMDAITKCMANFACFLKQNSLTPMNDPFEDYLRHLIDTESVNVLETTGENAEPLDSLLDRHKREKCLIEEFMVDGNGNSEGLLWLADIDESIDKVCMLKWNGNIIKDQLSSHREYKSRQFNG
ncbi:unnamed protein product [Oppiella nova]|uniref:Uncharacterized protein n=1 Tax=Oppiella nova TaxID=334625 RepID=A0A7R9QFR7_9ACAR|nr:unnamed protein product [Oppiella nova]CAG2164945.1 unnamed protein product [Oppiella nova]